jgi:Ca-activated chloride channel family protein
LAQRQEISVTMPVNVNVVPGDVAAGRIADPIVRAERLILEAQTAKSLAVDELLNGKIKEASTRLKGAASSLRREASLIPVTDERSAESLAIIKAEADEIDLLAQTAEDQDVMYSSKRMTESYSRKTRAKNDRNQIVDPTTIPDEFLN